MRADPRTLVTAPWLRTAALLALPLTFYLVPLLGGFGWSSINPTSPNVPGMEYRGRIPDTSISIEFFGTGVVVVPFQARLRSYLHDGHLPLWNPYQGLGQPFAAQGEGSPYFPTAIARALLPYSWGNAVTVAFVYVSTVAFYAFIRGLGGSPSAAAFAGLTWPLIGALTLHIPRHNIFDQVCMLPILFWAAERAIRIGRNVDRAVFAVTVGLNLLAGFIQIVVPATLALVGFLGLYGVQHFGLRRAAARQWLALALAFGLGHALAAVHLLPILESMRVAFNPRSETLAFLPMPYANLVAFFLPYLFGQYFSSWVRGPFTDIVDWNNLYGHLGATSALVALVGVVAAKSGPRRARLLFFAGFGAFLLLRYVSFPPVAAVNLLPLLSRQSPKHAHGVAAFCFVVAAALAIDAIRTRRAARVRWVVLAAVAGLVSTVMTLVTQRGGISAIDMPAAFIYVPVSAGIMVVGLSILYVARRTNWVEAPRIPILVLGAAMAELSLYLPLGNGTGQVLAGRVGVACLILAGAVLVALGRRLVGLLVLALSVGSYALIVWVPAVGLPHRFEVDTPPAHMRWLKDRAGDGYRSFGIAPDFASVAGIQDLDAVGPFSTQALADFIEITGTDVLRGYYGRVGVFRLHGSYEAGHVPDLRDYARAQPLYDWLGVRYLVLQKAAFRPGGRADYEWVANNGGAVRVAYEDDETLILESGGARPKAGFWTRFEVAASREDVLAALRAAPFRIHGPPLLEASELAADGPVPTQSEAGVAEQDVAVLSYTPNSVRLALEAARPGIVVLRDAFYPGWTATVDGVPTTVLRVNGLARGVYVAAPGRHEVTLTYRPASFVAGAALSASTAALLVATVVPFRSRSRRKPTATGQRARVLE